MNGDRWPTGRPAARRAEPSTYDLAGAFPGGVAATDSLSVVSTTSARPRRRQLRRMADQLSERDRRVLTSLAQLRLLQATQIERLHFREGSALTQARRARATLSRLYELGLVTRLDRRIGGLHAGSAGFIYRLSSKGRRLLDLTGPGGGRRRQLPEPTVRFQDHVLAVAELAIRLQEAERSGLCELLHFEAEPACWRRFVGAGGESLNLKPDAFVIIAIGDYEHLSFVEVDLDTEGSATIRRKGEIYRRYAGCGREQAAHGIFPRVVFLAQTEQRQRVLRAALQTTPDGAALFVVGSLADPVTALTGAAT